MKKPNKTLDVFSENQKQMIAKTLINLREVNFLTQTDIAHHLHLSSSTISHYEKGITVLILSISLDTFSTQNAK